MSERLTAELIPVIEAAGFIKVDVELGEASSPVAGSDLQFERTRGDQIDVIHVFFDKYARPRFQVNVFRKARSEPHELLSQAFLVKRSNEYYHVWGKPWWLPTRFWTEGRSKKTVRKVVGCLGQGIRFLETGERGPNINKPSGAVLRIRQPAATGSKLSVGHSLALLALQSADADSALSALGIVRSGEKVSYGSAPLTGYAMPEQWYVIVAEGCDNPLLETTVLQRVSAQYRLIACSIEEHVMFSSAQEWRSGKLVWRAEHVGENDTTNLKTSGTLPPSFEAARQEAEGGTDSEVDYFFEVPLVVAKALMGFKHDEELPGVDFEQFDLLARS
jgi:hypothetical protein